jgi:hypothetical protein
LGDVLQAASADAVGTLLVLLDLLESQPKASASFDWLISSMSRRIRRRLPTCLSIGLRAPLGICAPQMILRFTLRLVWWHAMRPSRASLKGSETPLLASPGPSRLARAAGSPSGKTPRA